MDHRSLASSTEAVKSSVVDGLKDLNVEVLGLR